MKITNRVIEQIIINVLPQDKSLAFDYATTHGYDITSFHPLNGAEEGFQLVGEQLLQDEQVQ